MLIPFPFRKEDAKYTDEDEMDWILMQKKTETCYIEDDPFRIYNEKDLSFWYPLLNENTWNQEPFCFEWCVGHRISDIENVCLLNELEPL